MDLGKGKDEVCGGHTKCEKVHVDVHSILPCAAGALQSIWSRESVCAHWEVSMWTGSAT